jgi:hypothetical protein
MTQLKIFSKYLYSTATELLAQQIDKFNAACRGAISLASASHQGDFEDTALYADIPGLVRRRNPYGTGAVSPVQLQHLLDTMVKIGAGTPPIDLEPKTFEWINRSPKEAGIIIAKQLAPKMLQDMLNAALMSIYAAMSQESAIIFDATSLSPDTMTPAHLNSGVAKFGDRGQDIAVWISHSKPLYDFFGTSLTNSQNLFRYETINVVADPFGKIFVITDSPALKSAASPAVYHVLGLVPGAAIVHQNTDFVDNIQTTNGDENIESSYQAQWSFNLGIKGFAYDKTHGGAAPNNAALAVTTNWDRYATSEKDLPGVIVEVN